MDDVFWRSQSSGARFTSRKKKGKLTYGQDGDIQAVRPEGNFLTQNISIECKRGYSRFPFSDFVESKTKTTPFLDFTEQARKGAADSGKEFWILIFKRDRKEALIFFPVELRKRFNIQHGGTVHGTLYRKKLGRIFFMRFDNFLKTNSPEQFQ